MKGATAALVLVLVFTTSLYAKTPQASLSELKQAYTQINSRHINTYNNLHSKGRGLRVVIEPADGHRSGVHETVHAFEVDMAQHQAVAARTFLETPDEWFLEYAERVGRNRPRKVGRVQGPGSRSRCSGFDVQARLPCCVSSLPQSGMRAKG